MSNLKFGELTPRLIDCNISQGDKKILVENAKMQAQVVLPLRFKDIITLFDGESNVQDIAAKMYETTGQVSFNDIIKAIHLLQKANLLEGVEENLENLKDGKTSSEQKQSLFNNSITITLIKSFKLNFQFQVLLQLLCFFCLAALGGAVYMHWPLHVSFANIFKNYPGSMGLIYFLVSTSFLFTFKAALKLILVFFGTGRINQLSIRINFFSVSLGFQDSIAYAEFSKFSAVLYSLVVISSHFIFYFICHTFLPELIPLNILLVTTILLSFIDLDPYRVSDLSKVFQFFYTDNQLQDMRPYLENCSLKTNNSIKFADELRLILYSLISFVWGISFILFSLELLVTNIPNLFFTFITLEDMHRYSYLYLVVFISFVFLYLSLDLVQTISKIILSPLKRLFSLSPSKAKSLKLEDIDREFVENALRNNHLFSDMGEETLTRIISFAKLKKLPKGKNLINQGQKGKEFYIILDGEVDVTVNKAVSGTKKVACLHSGAVIGEQAIVKETVRNANIEVKKDITFLEVEDSALKSIFEDQQYEADLKRFILKVEISQFISSSELFRDFPAEVMSLFVKAGDLTNFPKDHEIVTEGEIDKTFYLLIKGSADVLKGEDKVATLGQGDFFGEIALISNTPRTATVKMIEDGLLLYIEAKDFWQLLAEHIDLAMYIESIGMSRMQESA